MSEVQLRKVEPYTVNMELNEKEMNFEIDNSCSLTVRDQAMRQ